MNTPSRPHASPSDPWRSSSQRAMAVLLVGLVGFVAWAALSPLAEGVPTVGQVTLDTKRKAVQHLQGGIVRQVLVHEGQLVNEGDVLFKLDVLTAKSNHEAARRDVAGFQENLISQQALLRGIEQTDANRRKQLALIERELEGVKDLVREGYAPLVKQLQLESSKLDQQTAINELHTSRQRTRQAILELEHQIAAAQQKVVAVAQDLALLEIRAPASGQVVGLQVQSVGGVIQPAQKLLDIVPQQDTLMVETRVPPQHIDRLRAGQQVDVRFNSFPHSPQLVVDGRLQSVSKDVLSDADNKQSYYLARVEITPKGMQQLGPRVMQPGMSAEVVVQTGDRTVLQYLLHPLLRRLASAMNEV